MKKQVIGLMASIAVSASSSSKADNCLALTESYYRLPQGLLPAVRHQEAGKVGTISANKKNGRIVSYDYGPMQHNSETIKRLNKYGVTADKMLNSECASYFVAGWTLATSQHKFQDWRLAIAAYNCGDTRVANAVKKAGGKVSDITLLDIPPKTKNEYVPNVMAAWNRYLQPPKN
jgi:hypothetical protein